MAPVHGAAFIFVITDSIVSGERLMTADETSNMLQTKLAPSSAKERKGRRIHGRADRDERQNLGPKLSHA